ncbi:MAG: ribulose-phosphate 3-epimerase [Candidatus Goldbacteria bacterium]|nr:ribulose-phosphate 3-epimerase [Candidatus Goldiibacteriota bacterium]
MQKKLSVSILDSDFSKIKETIKRLEKNKVDWIHFDVMDGNFVPNLTFGAKLIKPLRKFSNLTFDTHLMIKKPEKYLQDFIDAGCDIITVHYEALKNFKKIIETIKRAGKKIGISIKPKTSVNVLKKYLCCIDLVLVMSVEPGFGGQKFNESVLQKVLQLKEIRKTKNYKYIIEIDGGINLQTAPIALKAGVDVIVVGNAIFSSENPFKTINKFKKLLK